MVFRSRVLLAVFCAWNLVMLAQRRHQRGGDRAREGGLRRVGDVGFGLLWAASGFGLLLGSLYAPRWLEVRGILLVYTGSLALMGFGALTARISPTVWVALPCMVLGGAGNGAAVVYNSLLVQRGAPDELRGRVFTVIMSTNFALLGLGMVVAGPLTDAIGARWVFALAAAVPGLGALVGFLCSVRSGTRPSARRRPSRSPCRADAWPGDWTRESLVAGIRDGDRRALARAISLVENGDPLAAASSHDLYPRHGRAHDDRRHRPAGRRQVEPHRRARPPRARARADGGRDLRRPLEPVLAGRLLGDRIRLSDHFLDPGVFIRSMGTRGHLGGLAEATLQALLLLDAARQGRRLRGDRRHRSERGGGGARG